MKSMLRRIRGLFCSEHGAAIVLTAFMLPTILCLTGLSVDVGRVYVAKSNLQNAADASALAGGHMYAGTNRNNAQTIDCVQSYTGKNIRNKAIAEGADTPADEDTVNVETRIANDNVDVYLRQRVPTVFLGAVGSLLHIGDYETLSVTAASRAHVAATGGTENNGFFDYTIFGAATTRWTKNDERGNSAHKQYKISGLTKDDMQPDNNPELASVTFKGNPHNPYKITGNIGSNGRVGVNNNSGGEYNFQMNGASGINDDGISRIDTSSLYGATNEFANPQGSASGPKNSKYNTSINTPPVDISFRASNPIMKDLYLFYQQVRDLCRTNLKAAEQKGWYCDDTTPSNQSYQFDAGGLTYYQGNLQWGKDLNPLGLQCNSNNIYKHSDGLTQDQERFRVIIVNGNITINMDKNGLHGWDMNERYADKDGDGKDHDNYALIISLHGDIRMHNSSKFRGIIYAPEGTVWLDSYDRVYANVIGQRVKVDNQDYDVESGPFLTKKNADSKDIPHIAGTSSVTVTLEAI